MWTVNWRIVSCDEGGDGQAAEMPALSLCGRGGRIWWINRELVSGLRKTHSASVIDRESRVHGHRCRMVSRCGEETRECLIILKSEKN